MLLLKVLHSTTAFFTKRGSQNITLHSQPQWLHYDFFSPPDIIHHYNTRVLVQQSLAGRSVGAPTAAATTNMAFVSQVPLQLRTRVGADVGTTSKRQRNFISALVPRRRATTYAALTPTGTPNALSPTPRVRFPALTADRFRHPVDVAATRMLQSVLGLEAVVATLLRAAEAAFTLEHLAIGVLVSETQMPSLHAAMRDACAVLDLPPPALYVRQAPVPNAYTLAFQGTRPAVVVTTALLELLDEVEVRAVLAHELGHLKCQHGLWLTAANLAVAALPMPAWIADSAATALLRWQRAAELSCDRAALLVAQDERVVLSVLMKLSGGAAGFKNEMDVDAFVKQADKFDKASNESPVARALAAAMVLSTSHPLPIYRAREIRKWMNTEAFRNIIAEGKPLLQN